ncbi:glycosyltransferase [Algoriphagus lacus]|uniref:Glycosyltransferase n=1 Tax=Algoriphagus lacus TaxID=2056311 RepID=A0A418PNY2_9BACT|nr:glycosyltransferase family protein [Algoriphagus lacus]RIW13641.1 glycosyltransferase [Algoriphagus lacus]
MKFIFIVQGEGRGHMTQAIAFSHLIRSQGHELSAVVVGKSKRRTIPDFFLEKIGAETLSLDSPNFESDGVDKRILLGKTIFKNTLNLPKFWKSLRQIHALIQEKEPDVVVNFYELLGGFYHLIFQPKAIFWAIGHQYLEAHPEFHFAPNRRLEKFLFRLNTRITALGARERLALSFLPKENTDKIRVVPPLLREEVTRLIPKTENFYLAYMVNPGYAGEIIEFAKIHPDVKIKAFWDKKGAAEVETPLPNLSFHRVNDRLFLDAMADCKGLVCTAGFESICEAMYLGKPVMVIPVDGQYEQACNALDTEASGVGIKSKKFDFNRLETFGTDSSSKSIEAIIWSGKWPTIVKGLINHYSPKDVILPVTPSYT